MNKKNLIILAIILIALIASASAYAAYNVYYVGKASSSATPSPNPTLSPTKSPLVTSSPTPSPYATSSPTATGTPIPTASSSPSPTATPSPTSVTVTDGNNDTLTIALPVTRIVTITSTTTEMLCVMGCGSEIVGVDTSSVTPPSLANVPVMLPRK